MGYISTSLTMAASVSLILGIYMRLSFLFLTRVVIGRIPFVCLKVPSIDNSPKNNDSEIFGATCHDSINIPSAMGRSYAGPIFGRSAGAKFTVIRLIGKSAPEFLIAERTLSFDSSTALSGKPTIVKLGNPWVATSTSTSTKTAFNPDTAPEVIFASIDNYIQYNTISKYLKDEDMLIRFSTCVMTSVVFVFTWVILTCRII